jgi:nucleotide-binding universal stress UspA family protein
MRRSYVVAHDGTDRGADAVALARLLAGPGGMPVRIVHVRRRASPWEDANAERAERARVRALQERVRLPGDPLPLIVTADSAARGLHDVAEREPAAMIVLGSAPGGEPGRTHPGVTASRLLHGAPCAVAIAPAGFAEREAPAIRVIGVAVDADPESRQAVHHAVGLARRFRAHVRLLTCIDPEAEAEILGAPELADDIRRALVERGEELLRDAIGDVPSDVELETRVCHGDPAAALVAATDRGVDLLVCGSRGYGPRDVVLLGTITHQLIARAGCPVLVVPRGAQPRDATRTVRRTTDRFGAAQRMAARRHPHGVATWTSDRRAP